MIVERCTFNVKVGCMEKLVELVKAENVRDPFPHKMRIYTPGLAKYDVLAVEFEFENLAELDKYWEAYFAEPATAEIQNKMNELVERGGTNETWYLEE